MHLSALRGNNGYDCEYWVPITVVYLSLSDAMITDKTRVEVLIEHRPPPNASSSWIRIVIQNALPDPDSLVMRIVTKV